MEKLQVKLLSSEAKLPTKASEGDAGFDLYSTCNQVIPRNTPALIPTGIAIKTPPNTYGRIAERSSLSLKQISVHAGVVDSGYTGEVHVLLYNYGQDAYIVRKHQRIAQLILESICNAEVEKVTRLATTERGEGAFGSSGE